ncbi:afamin isoform X2 [Mustela putorius furo]|uniref:Afamin isoform X2 n=1 Tax=Mustela putorius furo TaxID=9669 RepID=A0A8U0NZQ8_MUSPF|nr:afamin isoform X2 [Mustela putorius furo]
MKQLKLTGFVIFLFFVPESLTLPTQPQDVDDVSITQKFIEENVGYITIIVFAQHIQEASFEEVEVLVNAMKEYRDKCLGDRTLLMCSKSANDVLLENICALEGLPQKHNFSHCCSKVDLERKLCFFHNKKADVGFLPPLPTLDPEEKCQTYKNNRESFLNNYVYEVSRRSPFVFAPTLLTVAARFEEMTKTCCEAQDKANCFRTNAEPVIQYLKASSSFQKNVCGAFMKFGPQVLGLMFLYEYSRRHLELSVPELLRIAGVYENLLKECCRTENPPDCYRHAEYKFNETTEKSLKIVQRECEHFQNLGKDDLKYYYLIKLTKIAPQLSTEELTFLGKEMVTALATCCTLSEEFACVDNLMDLVLGELCGLNENRNINPDVDHCCKTNFAFRRPCFEGLEADKTYKPPCTPQDLFVFHTDLCQSHNEELQRKKDRFLVNVVKRGPELTEAVLRPLLSDFTDVVAKCCKAEDPETCFREEGPKVAAKSQAA